MKNPINESKKYQEEKIMAERLKKVLGTILFMAGIAASAVTVVQASQEYTYMKNTRII